MLDIKYSNKAKLDLHDALDFISKDSSKNALNYLKDYENKIEMLRQNPHIGSKCKNKNIQQDCRVLIFKSHIIVYKITKNEILIIRIFHASQDYQNKYF